MICLESCSTVRCLLNCHWVLTFCRRNDKTSLHTSLHLCSSSSLTLLSVDSALKESIAVHSSKETLIDVYTTPRIRQLPLGRNQTFLLRRAVNTALNFWDNVSSVPSVVCLLRSALPGPYLTQFSVQWRNLYFSISPELCMRLHFFQKGVIFPIYPAFVLPGPLTTHLPAAKYSHAK